MQGMDIVRRPLVGLHWGNINYPKQGSGLKRVAFNIKRKNKVNVITVSRFSQYYGAEFATAVAEKLNYRCISKEVFSEAAERYQTPEIKLMAAVDKPISIIDHLMSVKEKYVSYIGSTILKNILEGNVIYHGMAGHFFVTGVSHVIRIGVAAERLDRARITMEREGLDRSQALQTIEKQDRDRQQWGRKVLGIDTQDANTYDLVLNRSRISMDDAVYMVCQLAGSPAFKATSQSQKVLEDLYLASQVKIALIDNWPDCGIVVTEGAVEVDVTQGHFLDEEYHEADIKEKVFLLTRDIEGIQKLRVNIHFY